MYEFLTDKNLERIWKIIVDYGQKDRNFKLGDSIKYTPSDIVQILKYYRVKEKCNHSCGMTWIKTSQVDEKWHRPEDKLPPVGSVNADVLSDLILMKLPRNTYEVGYYYNNDVYKYFSNQNGQVIDSVEAWRYLPECDIEGEDDED